MCYMHIKVPTNYKKYKGFKLKPVRILLPTSPRFKIYMGGRTKSIPSSYNTMLLTF